MVSIHSAHNPEDLPSWLATLTSVYSADETALIERACQLAAPLYNGKIELTGTPLMQHALGSASILLSMNMDAETVAATLLHAVPEYLTDWQSVIETQFGATVSALVQGIFRMEQIQHFNELTPKSDTQTDAAAQVERLRKMLLTMVSDIRVVLIKLAERTQTLRCLSGATPAQQSRIAQETQSLFAPLANRLGVWQIKWEMEDLSVRYLEPQRYKAVAKLLDERRVDRENTIADMIQQLTQTLAQAGIKAEVTGRPKHIYSIINKMKRKQLNFDQLYDVRAVRILVEDVESCYSALSLVHERWSPIASEFDDYIARPKSNNYRSLHTAISGPRGQTFEVQIRTHEMHQHSELGVAAHWRYKEGKQSDALFDEKIIWLRQILKWKQDVTDNKDMQTEFSSELVQARVYVFTPQGRVIDLPTGSTPVDFAYTLHTDLGHRTRGAKVDGSIVPLNYKLQNGQRVEILTTKLGAPSRDWVNPSLGFLQTSHARAKVRAWFKAQNYDDNVMQGRIQLDRELQRLGASSVNQEKLAQRLHFNKLDDLLAALGRNELTLHRIAVALQEELPTKAIAIFKPVFKPATEKSGKAGVLVEGLANLVTRQAKCCHPTPPDDIIGYITRDRGLTLHRQDCAFVQRMKRTERLLKATWDA